MISFMMEFRIFILGIYATTRTKTCELFFRHFNNNGYDFAESKKICYYLLINNF